MDKVQHLRKDNCFSLEHDGKTISELELVDSLIITFSQSTPALLYLTVHHCQPSFLLLTINRLLSLPSSTLIHVVLITSHHKY